jgi:hypothetical protein
MRIGLHVLCFVAFASTATAQSSIAPFPGAVNINGGWVPCSHQIAIDAGKGCGTTTPTPTPSANACDPWPSPYTEPARFLACLATRPEPSTEDDAAPVTVYHVGQRYHDGYPSRVMIVLAVALGVDGTPHVLAQWLTPNGNGQAGDTFTFSANEHHPWIRYRGAQ